MVRVSAFFYIMTSVALLAACNSEPSTSVSSTNAALTADIASSGSSGGVAGGELIPVNDVVLTSDPGDPDATVPTLALTGQANITGSFRAIDFARVVLNCTLYEASSAISGPVAPDASGRMNFSGLAILVPAMGETRIGVRCDFDNALDNPSGELVTVGIAGVVDIQAIGSDMGAIPVTVTTTAMREAGATSDDPLFGVPVAPAGDILVTFDAASAATIVPDGTLQVIASGIISAAGEDIVLESARLSLAGDAASYADVAIFIGGDQIGTATAGSGIDTALDVTLTGGMSILRRDVIQSFELRARLATLVPRSSVGSPNGSPVSGNRIALGFESLSGTGATSAAPCSSPTSPEVGSLLVIRGSSLTISFEEVEGSLLFRGRSFPFMRMVATGQGELGRIVLEFDRTGTPDFATTPPSYQFYGMNVFQDGAPVDTATIFAEDGTDLLTAVYLFPVMDIAYAVLSFPGGLVIDGTSTIELQMALQGDIQSTDVLSIGIASSSAMATATGYLADDTSGVVGPRPTSSLDLGTDLGPGGASAPFVLAWSDATDSPHNTMTASTGGSRDWINEFGLGDLSVRSVIHAP